jgi:protoheme IX farnesyltransferase
MSDIGYQAGVMAPARTATAAGGSVGDFLALMKPRVMSLVVFTAFTGMVLAPGHLHPVLAAIALIAIAVGAGAAGALNMWYDADIDALMQRTQNRPIPRGRVTPEEALAFGVVLAVGAVMTLGVLVNWAAGGLLALTIGFYIFIYTMWLKRRTAHNIVIGGAAGAIPPMIGWAAVTGGVSREAIVLFLLIFVWTPPHFWALSLYRARDYERAGVPMLPVVAGADETRRQILLYSLVLVALAVLPYAMGLGGPLYAAAACALGAVFLTLSAKVFCVREGRAADRAAKRLFAFSILYLFVLFGALLLERGIWRLAA